MQRKAKIMNEMYEFSNIIKELRRKEEMTQREVAEKIGVRYQSYQAYELGLSLPSLENFIKLADLFEVSLDYLIGRKDY